MILPFQAFTALIRASQQGKIEQLALFLGDQASTHLLRFTQNPRSLSEVKLSPTGEINVTYSLPWLHIARTLNSEFSELQGKPEFLDTVSLRVAQFFIEAGWVVLQHKLTSVHYHPDNNHLQVDFSFQQSK